MAEEAKTNAVQREDLPLSKAALYILEECRMVLPGIQALFGFQLIAVFNQGFSEKLSAGEQRLHLLAIMLLAIAIALIMTPAAYHRQTGPQEVTSGFIRLASRLLLASMAPLAVSICIDFYLVGHVIYDGFLVPLLAALLFATIITLWFVLPRVRSLMRADSRRR
ncbi:MAG: hypothetical protein JWR69_2452 [Pedosphaera sp.]|nr:hypothetical protein [Pedosphaera sp.]